MITEHGHQRRVLPLVLVPLALLVVVVSISRSRHDDKRPAEIDELYWIGSAYYFDLAFVRGDWKHPDWQLLPARENPPVGKYLIGAALYLADVHITSPDRLGSFFMAFHDWGWGKGKAREKRQAVADRMSPSARQAMGNGFYQPLTRYELRVGRALMAAFGFLCALGIASIGRAISGPRTGALAALAFVLHPAIIGIYTRVSVDVIALCFSILAVRLLLAILDSTWRDAGLSMSRAAVLAIAMMGALVGACGSKMNALIVVALAASTWLYACVKIVLSKGEKSSRPAWALGIALAAAPFVFIALDPTLYPAPISGLHALTEEHRLTALIQKEFLVGNDSWLPAGSPRAFAVASLVGIRAELFLLLAVAALWQSAVGLGRFSATTVVCLWWWIGLTLVVLWIPFPWGRYVVPIIPPGLLLVAKTLLELGGSFCRRPDHPPLMDGG